jgi:hypothetical protein
MDVPGIVESALEDETVRAEISLGGEDALYVTPTRTLAYSGDGLLSDEAVEAYSLDAERVEVDAGRRKATIRLDHGLDGASEFAVPASALEEALEPILAGVLDAAGVLDEDETVTAAHRFSELTLVVTSDRVVKHVGAAVWDEEFEQVHFADVTGLAVEEGSVATQLVLATADRTRRIKTPADRARGVRESVENALLAYHGVESYAAFERQVEAQADSDNAEADEDAEDTAAGTGDASEESDAVDFGDDLSLIGEADGVEADAADDEAASGDSETSAGATEEADDSGAGGFGKSGFEPATASQTAKPPALDREDLAAELRTLAEVVERQQELLAQQQAVIESLTEAVEREE